MSGFTQGAGQGMGFGCGCLLLIAGIVFVLIVMATP